MIVNFLNYKYSIVISILGRCEVFGEIHPNLMRPAAHNEENIDSDYDQISEEDDEDGDSSVDE